MNEGIARINTAIASLDQMTQQNSALVEQSAAAAESLREQATQLAATVRTFKLDRQAELPGSIAWGGARGIAVHRLTS